MENFEPFPLCARHALASMGPRLNSHIDLFTYDDVDARMLYLQWGHGYSTMESCRR